MSLILQSYTFDNTRALARLERAQKVIDSEVIRRCEPLVPFKIGNLKRSGITGTKIGSGVVRYTAPYAKYQYYCGRKVGNNGRGRKWFGRMKFMHRHAIRKIAQKELNKP